jgi:hypothetical protein
MNERPNTEGLSLTLLPGCVFWHSTGTTCTPCLGPPAARFLIPATDRGTPQFQCGPAQAILQEQIAGPSYINAGGVRMTPQLFLIRDVRQLKVPPQRIAHLFLTGKLTKP